MSDSSRIGLRLHGRVQGVGFRWWCARTARGLGLNGTVENCTDGSVEVRAEGPEEALERFRERLAVGPPMARVDRIEPFDLNGEPQSVEGFEIVT